MKFDDIKSYMETLPNDQFVIIPPTDEKALKTSDIDRIIERLKTGENDLSVLQSLVHDSKKEIFSREIIKSVVHAWEIEKRSREQV